MEKHIIFSDVDGTVYAFDKVIHPQTIKDIKLAQDLGVEFAICTGNPAFEGAAMIDLAEKLKARYIVSSNGASLYDMNTRDFIYTSVIPEKKAKEIFDYSIKNKMSAFWWIEKGVYGNPIVSEELNSAVSHFILGKGKDPMKPKESIEGEILKFEFMDDSKLIDKAQDYWEKDGLQVARTYDRGLEITHSGVSKGHGVQKLCELLGVKLENTMGIGDSANDLGMFEVVGSAYAMDNAKDEIKDKAHHVTLHVAKNGLGEAIRDYLKSNGIYKG